MTNEKCNLKLTAINYRQDDSQNPEFEVERETIGYFSSFEEVEQAVKQHNEKCCDAEKPFRYSVETVNDNKPANPISDDEMEKRLCDLLKDTDINIYRFSIDCSSEEREELDKKLYATTCVEQMEALYKSYGGTVKKIK